MNDDTRNVIDAMARLEAMNRQDTVIATVAREALSDIQELLDSWGYLPGVGECYKSNQSPSALPLLRHLRRLLEAEEVQRNDNQSH